MSEEDGKIGFEGHEKAAALADGFSMMASAAGCGSRDVIDALVIILHVYTKFEDVTMIETIAVLLGRLATMKCSIELGPRETERAKA